MKTAKLADSIAMIAAHSPAEALGPGSRYVIAADLRMGDGGKKDALAAARKALYAILGYWYLPRGYTLVLNGDVEDLQKFWLKDILAAWPKMYALFDAFADGGRLRKIVGERDLALLRLGSYPYELSHSLRLDGERSSILVLHGHQASEPYIGRDYLSDYMQRWLGSSKPPKREGRDDDRGERLKVERRLYRAASGLGIAAIEGHTKRPLFESLTNREAVRGEIDRLLRESASPYVPPERRASSSPCLFCPGRVLGSKGLRFLEIDGESLGLVRWVRTEGRKAGPMRAGDLASPDVAPRFLEGTPYARLEIRSTRVDGLLERVGLFAKGDIL